MPVESVKPRGQEKRFSRKGAKAQSFKKESPNLCFPPLTSCLSGLARDDFESGEKNFPAKAQRRQG
jgi:hypothetical protein